MSSLSVRFCSEEIPSNGFYPDKCVAHHYMEGSWGDQCMTEEQGKRMAATLFKPMDPICFYETPPESFYPGKCIEHHNLPLREQCATEEQLQQMLSGGMSPETGSSDLMIAVKIASNFFLGRGCKQLNRITEALVPARFSKTIRGIKYCQFAAAIFIPAVGNVVKAVGAMDFAAEKIRNLAVDVPADLFG